MALINNNGYWYQVWLEPGRKQKKKPIKDGSGKTLKVVYNAKGKPNRDQAFILSNGNSVSNGKEVVKKTTIAQGLVEAKEYWVSKSLKELTINEYQRNIERVEKHLPYVEDTELSDIVNLGINLNKILGRELKPITRIGYIKSLSTFYNALVKRGVLKINPVIGYDFETEDNIIEPFNETQLLRLSDAAEALEKQTGLPYFILLMVAFQMGLRLSEYVNLRWQHLDWKKQQYNIFQDSTFDPKYSKSRTIYIPKISFNLLKKIKKDEGYIFCKPNGGKWDMHFNRDFVADIFKVADIKLTEHQHPDLHQIRKTFTSWRLACGQPAYRLKDELGHRSVVTLEKHYAGRVSNPSKKMREIFGDYR